MNKLIIAYGFTLSLLGFFSLLFIDQNFIYLKVLYTGFYSSNRQIVSFLFFMLISFCYILYFLILNEEINFKKINKKLVLFFLALLIFSNPTLLSYDIFNYIATAKVAFYYFENPYVVMPIEFLNDPLLMFTHAANKIALYGPLWIVITGLPFILSFGNYLISIVLFKLVVVSAYFGIVYVIWKLSGNVKSVIFFAASPLVIIETFVSGHNDTVMMFFAVSSIYFLKTNKLRLSAVLIIASVLIKYATIFLVPLFVYLIVKKILKKHIDWERVYLFGFISMSVIFSLSFIREEIYPWYAIWPLVFAALIKNSFLKKISVFIAFGLMLRYIPFMYLGNHFGITPYLKIALMILPPFAYLSYYLFRKYIRNL